MSYSNFQTDASGVYLGVGTGAAYVIQLVAEDDPSVSFTGFSGMSINEAFEAIPVEEAGNDGVDEIAQGRHTVAVSFNGFFRPETNDGQMVTRQSFIGRRFVAFRKVARGTFADTVIDVVTGVTVDSQGTQQGARGAITFTTSAQATRRYNGAEWAARTGG